MSVNVANQGIIINMQNKTKRRNSDSKALYIRVIKNSVCDTVIFSPQIICLTDLYGAGNKPATVAQFKTKYPNILYTYITDLSTINISVKNSDDVVMQTATSTADGTVSGLTSISPITKITSDNGGASIKVNYT